MLKEHTSRPEGPEMRTMAIPALPGAVDKAYIVSFSRMKLCFGPECRWLCDLCGSGRGLASFKELRAGDLSEQKVARIRRWHDANGRYTLVFAAAFRSIDLCMVLSAGVDR